MVNDFIKGAASALKELELPIYIEEIPMNFSKPCIGIYCENVKAEPYLCGFFKETVTLGFELYMSEKGGNATALENGKNYRLGEYEAYFYEALRFVKAGNRIYCAKAINSRRKSQMISGTVVSNVEGLGGILYIRAEYCRYVKKIEQDVSGGIMEDLFENFN